MPICFLKFPNPFFNLLIQKILPHFYVFPYLCILDNLFMAKDIFHSNVRIALEKEGWDITHDPYPIKIGEVPMEIDLGAEKLIAAERGLERIAIEVKSFVGKSPVHDFHEAIGQFGNYRSALRFKEPDRLLFLAIPEEVYMDFFQRKFVQIRLKEENVKLLIFEPYSNIIAKWIN